MRVTMREAAEKAFRLAYFIHLNRPLAVGITARALSKLEVSIARQWKRRYYLPRRKVRTKVSLDELQELQRLVFHESETCEKRQEQAADSAGLADADWLIRFVKHLVAITVERSAFYVALGLSRLLFNYSTAETIRIYDAVRQDAERSKDGPYFRKQKTALMKEMKERFGAVLQTRRVSHGEERFVAREDSGCYVVLVRQCLNMFTLWDTTCVLPERFDPVSDTIDALRFDGEKPDEEHPVEVRRMHTLLHPDCYQRLVTALGFAPPTQCLSVPTFFRCPDADDDDQPNDRERLPSGLLEEELTEISGFIKDESARRRKAPPASLSVRVDGSERATLGLDDPRPARLTVGGGARLLEISGRDARGEVLLAYLFLDHGELRRAQPSKRYSFRLARARKLLLSVSPRVDVGGEIEGADLELAYRRAWPLSAATRFVQRPSEGRLPRALRRPTLAFGMICLTLLIAGLLIGTSLLRRRSSTAPSESEYLARVEEPITSAPTPVLGTDSGREGSQPEKNPNSASSRRRGTHRLSGLTSPANASDRPSRIGRSAEGVRDFEPESVRALLSVKLVYVEEHKNSSDAKLRESIKSRIVEGRRLQISEEPRQADAFLLWSLKRAKAGRRVEARLTDRQGRELWSAFQPVTGAAGDQDAAARAASRLAQSLLDDIVRREGGIK